MSFSCLLAMAAGQPGRLVNARVKIGVGGAIRSAPSCGGPSDWTGLKVKHAFPSVKSWHLFNSKSAHSILLHFILKRNSAVWTTEHNFYISSHTLAAYLPHLSILKKKPTHPHPHTNSNTELMNPKWTVFIDPISHKIVNLSNSFFDYI